ncbi:DUF5666 domain-containing protein [Leifsonia sp. NPDC077715]|uniref:DUF5666 domain-containing protein n=1 Tax=Leifsonia sp. NPDC077715 TaxID=3155539 RepID=UPI00341A16C3
MDNNDTEPLTAADSHGAPASSAERQPVVESAPSFLRRHAVGVGVAAAALAVIVVAGGTAWGVSAAVASTQTAAVAPAAQSAMHKTGPHTGASGKRKAEHGARGTLTAVNGDTWTLKTASGTTVSVKITSSTAFGTKKSPAARDSFASGDRIGVLGTRSGDSVTATRIVHIPLHAHTAPPTPAPSV